MAVTGQNQDGELLGQFIDETTTGLSVMNEKLLEIEKGNGDPALVHEIFRAAHSIKGMAGFFNLARISKITHNMETVLDRVRKGKMAFNPAIIEALFNGCDALHAMLGNLQSSGAEGDLDAIPIIAALEAVLSEPKAAPAASTDADLEPLPDFLKGKFDMDDVLESLIARNAGKRVYALLLSFKKIFAANLDPVHLYHEIEANVQIQTVIALPKMADSPWRLISDYDYEVAILCFSPAPIKDALDTVVLPRCEAWELCDATQPTPLTVIEPATSIMRGERGGGRVVIPEMEKHRDFWISQTREDLDALDHSVLAYEKAPADISHLREIFRVVHTIKGSSATMGLAEMSRLAHNCESLLSPLREGGHIPDAAFFQLLYGVKDFLAACVARVASGTSPTPDSSTLDGLMEMTLSKGGGRRERRTVRMRLDAIRR